MHTHHPGPVERQIITQLSIIYSEEDAWTWLSSPQRLLNGEVPLTMIDRGRADEVMRIVELIRGGAHL